MWYVDIPPLDNYRTNKIRIVQDNDDQGTQAQGQWKSAKTLKCWPIIPGLRILKSLSIRNL